MFDNNLSPRFARMLNALGVEAMAVRDEMPANTSDTEIIQWMEERKGDWGFITADRRTQTRPLEAPIFMRSKVTVIYLARFWNKMTFWKQAAWLVKHWENIDGFCNGAEKGICAEFKQNGRANLLTF